MGAPDELVHDPELALACVRARGRTCLALKLFESEELVAKCQLERVPLATPIAVDENAPSTTLVPLARYSDIHAKSLSSHSPARQTDHRLCITFAIIQ